MSAKDDLVTQIFPEPRDNVDMRALWKEIEGLRHAHAVEVMHLLFDEDGRHTGMTMKAVGQIIGVTLERVRQIRQRSIRTLRHPVRIRRYVPTWDSQP